MAFKILWNNFEKKNKLFEFLFLERVFCFSPATEGVAVSFKCIILLYLSIIKHKWPYYGF
jgi:hypothetical protein